MDRIRDVTARPTLIVSDRADRVEDPARTQVGIAGPVGRERVIFALPLNGYGPLQLAQQQSLHGDNFYLADPGGNLIGVSNAVWVSRLLGTQWTQDTRRLGV